MNKGYGEKRISIIGGGPIGIEAGICGVRLGFDIQIFEKREIGANIRVGDS